LKRENVSVGGTTKWTAGKWIEWNEVDLAVDALDQGDQPLRIGFSVINARQQHVLEGQPSVARQWISAAGRKQRFE
jgi:hypothetical protein